MPKLSLKRVLAEIIAKADYPRLQRLYWQLRAGDIASRYEHELDFSYLGSIIEKFGIKKILDLGCGAGRLFPLFSSKHAAQVVGFEVSEKLLVLAKERAKKLESEGSTSYLLFDCDIRQQFPWTGELDIVISHRVLQHIDPSCISDVIRQVVSLKPSLLYLNESQNSKSNSSYLFCHDYESILGKFDYKPVEKGVIPELMYEYCLFKKCC